MTTHNISEGLEISDRIAILSAGRIAYENETSEVQLEGFKKIYSEKVNI
jgi:ABC-type multidrug transport system ATPase subunit